MKVQQESGGFLDLIVKMDVKCFIMYMEMTGAYYFIGERLTCNVRRPVIVIDELFRRFYIDNVLVANLPISEEIQKITQESFWSGYNSAKKIFSEE